MLKLKFNLRHQDIQFVNKGVVVATDSKDYLVAKFNTISDDWETPLTAVFTDDKHNQPYAVVVGTDERLAEDECFVPWEVLTDVANVYVSVYCGNLHTTVTAAFRVQKSGYVEGETPPPPSPTVYDIIIQAIEDLRAGKQDKLIAGQNITIEGNVISASGGASDYTDLENKPQINSHTLSGNKSSDDLGLQKKLTAGTNITIENDGTISADGGVTSYEDLENKPQINGHELVGNKSSDDLGLQNKLTAGENITINANGEISVTGGVTDYNGLTNKPQIRFTGQRKTLNGILDFYFGDFTGQALPDGVMISLRENVFKSVLSPTGYILYNFNVIASNLLLTGVYKIRKVDVTNLPREFSNAGQILYVFHYLTNKTYSNLIRMVTYETSNGVKVWVQLVTLGGADESGNTLVNTSTAWTDLTNQIGYTLTEQDKQDIADIVIQRLQGGD